MSRGVELASLNTPTHTSQRACQAWEARHEEPQERFRSDISDICIRLQPCLVGKATNFVQPIDFHAF